MSYLRPRILLRKHDRVGLSPREALSWAETAMKDGRPNDAERLIEIVYEGFDSITNVKATHH